MPPSRLYLDNAATSFPKPPPVAQAMADYARTLGVPARGSYPEARETARLIDRCRARINTLINGESPSPTTHVVFTLNTTDAMNLAIKGIVHRRLRTTTSPIHLITSEADHNSALRPFNALVEQHPARITQTRLPIDPATGLVDPDDLRRALTPHTALVAINHASNVTGTIQPAAELGAICRERGVTFLLDAAQSLGHIPVDVRAMHVDLLAFPGHKGLLGPTGTGGLYIRPGIENAMDTLREGGTGFRSELEAMPTHLPDRFEPGSHNAVGIVGLSEGVQWLLDQGPRTREHELHLIRLTLDTLTGDSAPHGLRLLGPTTPEARVGVFSIVHDTLSPTDLGAALERDHNILTRSGLHCAPLAHAALGTREDANHADPSRHGATRFSYGPFNTEADVQAITTALRAICAQPVAAK
ncbi:MAG: aminotransferase class V-fold PLP-dependent enzyme [Phycisphaerales bacterium]